MQVKCQVPNCNDIATTKIFLDMRLNTLPVRKCLNVCAAHAFILLGKQDNCYIVECPVCHTQFGYD